MELIKQIKDAENQAKEIFEKARKDAVVLAERTRLDYEEQFRKAQIKRQETIDNSIALAQQKAQSQVEELAAQGRQEIEAVKQMAGRSMESCVAVIMSRLK